MILIHHIYQNVLLGSDYSIVDYTLRSFGYWGVTTFFALSGYGLMYSVTQGGKEYFLKLKNKCVNMYFLTVFLIFLYWGTYSLLGIDVDTNRVMQSFLYGHTIIVAGWYLQSTILFYIGFLLLYKFDSSILFYRNYTLFVVLYIIVIFLLKFPIHWYISCLGLPMGMYLYKYQDKLYSIFESSYKFSFFLILTLFLVSTIWIYLRPEIGVLGKVVKLSCQFLQGVWFALLVVVIVQKINIGGKVIGCLGKYSLEIFLLQGIAFSFLKNGIWEINNPVILFRYLLY